MTCSVSFVRFNAGEISDLMGGRVDTEEYKGACKVLENFVPSVQGPVSRRGGTRFVAETKKNEAKARLFAFQFSAEQAYLLEFGDGYVRFFTGRRPVLDDQGQPLELALPYAEKDLDGLCFAQSGDVVYIAHPSYPLRTLTRHGRTDWRTAEAGTVDGPYLPVHTGDVALTSSAVDGDIKITATADVFSETDVGRAVRIMQSGNPDVKWGAAKITRFIGAHQVEAAVFSGWSFLNTTASKAWRLGVFCETTGYPAVVSFFEQRLILGKGNGVYGSKVGQYDVFSPTAPDASVSSQYGYNYELSSDQINDVCWLSPGRVLAIGTVGADFTLETSGGEGTIPMTVKARRHSAYGSESVAPVKVGSATLFVQRCGRKLRAFAYNSNSDDYVARDLTVLAPHVTQSGIVQMALQQEPVPVVWCVLKNGALAGLTYEAAESVTAWHRHEIAGGRVESAAALPAPDGGRDDLFLLVRRVVNGRVRRYVEVMEAGIAEDAADTAECFFVDSGLSYHGQPVSKVAGLDHLEDETVAVLANGAVQTEKVVQNGEIALDAPASVVHAGLPFTSVLETMPLANVGDGASETSKKRVSGVQLRLYRSLGFSAGTRGGVERQSFRRIGDKTDTPPDLFTGDRKVSLSAPWDVTAGVRIEQDQPLPLTVSGIFATVSVHKI